MTVNLKNFIYQKAGKYLQWNEIASGISAVNGTPTPGTSGIVVSDFDVAKLAVEPQNGATVNFRLWYQYEGLSQFFVVDSSERNNITTNWTQEIDISGLDRIYVEILSIDTGSVDVHVAQAEDKETILGFKRIGNWEEAGTGDQDGDVMVWKNDSGQEALFEWDGTNSIWILQSTGEEWFLLDDWASGEINDSLWTTATNNAEPTYTVNGASNRIEFDFTTNASTTTEELSITANFEIPKTLEVYSELNLNGTGAPTTGNVTLRSLIYYNGLLDDGIHSMLQRSPTGADFVVLNRPVGGGSSTILNDPIANDTISHNVYASTKNVLDEETQFNAGYTQTGSSTFLESTMATSNEFTHVVNTNNAKLSVFAVSTADVATTVYLGPVYIRR